MAATTILRTLLLFLAVWRGGAICTTSYTSYGGMTVYNIGPIPTLMNANILVACHLECNPLDNCYGYLFDDTKENGDKCRHILFYFELSHIYPSNDPSVTLYKRNCDIPTRPPPTTSTTTRPPPPTQPTPLPTAPPTCPPAAGVSTGIVVLIVVFTAIGGIILGMLLSSKCCPKGHGGSWFSAADHGPHCMCQKCKPVHVSHSCKDPGCTSCNKPVQVCHSYSTPSCTSGHQVAPPSCNTCHIPGCTECHPPQHPHLLHLKPGNIIPALPSTGCVTPGQTFSVAASPCNDVYTVNLGGH